MTAGSFLGDEARYRARAIVHLANEGAFAGFETFATFDFCQFAYAHLLRMPFGLLVLVVLRRRPLASRGFVPDVVLGGARRDALPPRPVDVELPAQAQTTERSSATWPITCCLSVVGVSASKRACTAAAEAA